MSEVFHTDLFKDVVILVDVERRTVFRSELAVAMKCGFWKALVKICEDFHECLFLFRGACVLGFEFAVSRMTVTAMRFSLWIGSSWSAVALILRATLGDCISR